MTLGLTIKDFDRTNGLGTISFSADLISSIIKKVLSSFPSFEYITHSIKEVTSEYYEVSISLKQKSYDLNIKELDRLEKELLIVMKQSLSLNSVLILNISNGK